MAARDAVIDSARQRAWNRALVSVCLLCVAGVLGAGCGGSTGAPGASSSGGTPTTAASSTATSRPSSTGDSLDPGRLVLPTPGVSTTVPTERGGNRPISPVVDAGQQILITPEGFVPHQLFANVAKPVVWTNLSKAPQQIVFDYFSADLPVIPPGAQLVWTPSTAVEIAYRSTSGFEGVLTLQPAGVG